MIEAERIELASILAPIVRGLDASVAKRKVKLYNVATGEVTGETDVGEMLRQAAVRVSLEFDTFAAKEKREKEAKFLFVCKVCKVKSKRSCRAPSHQKFCKTCSVVRCFDCSKDLGKTARAKGRIRCISCHLQRISREIINCADCNKPLSKNAKRQINIRCTSCERKTRIKLKINCVDCAKQLGKNARSMGTVRCGSCSHKSGRV